MANNTGGSAATKIVLIVLCFPRLSETFIVSKFIGLLDRSYNVHIVCQESPSKQWTYYPELAAQPGIQQRVHVDYPTSAHWLVPILFIWVLLRCLVRRPALTLRYLRRGLPRFGIRVLRHFYLDAQILLAAPDIVHFEFGAQAVGRTHLSNLLGCKLSVSFRGYDLNYVGLEAENYYREIWEHADKLHFLGENLWQRALQRGCPPNQSRMLIPPAVDTDSFRSNFKEVPRCSRALQGPIRLLSVGRLEWVKGLEYALEAVSLVKEQGISLEYTIIGDGSYWQAVVYLRYKLGLADCVSLVGSMTQQQVMNMLKEADIFLHAAVSEGFCNAVLEAQAMGLPVVTSNAGGLPENVVDGLTGFVVPRRNSEALAKKIVLLANSPDLRRQMGNAGRQRILDHFRIDQQSAAFDAFYTDLTRQRRSS